MKRFLTLIGFVGALSFLPVQNADAQCPMCRMSAESNLKEGGSDGKGLNKGILYMLAAPYLFAGVLGYTYFKYQRKTKEEQKLSELARIEKGQLN
jgi:hypothetical protein